MLRSFKETVESLPKGGKINLAQKVYEITEDVVYTLTHKKAGPLIIEGKGAFGNEYDPLNSGGTVLYFNKANFVDGKSGDWNEAGASVLMLRNLGLVFEGDGVGKGKWIAPLTVPFLEHVSLQIRGAYPDRDIVLFGRQSGPVGIAAVWTDVHLQFAWTKGINVRGMQLHLDAFSWVGGHLLTHLGRDVTEPLLMHLDSVFNYTIKNVSVFRADNIPVTYFLVSKPKSEAHKGMIVLEDITLFDPVNHHFVNVGDVATHIDLKNVWFDSPPKLSSWPPSAPLPILHFRGDFP